ncbi:hypothetical protein DOS84_15360 [Flavobacterium aquariorum]|uniref:Short-chain dehydrogenase n=1 Tax=Flavobacterium aquariorum TaxID=2217670 RepID=A0A2W7TSA1_9FLAO|nr:SDR family NAD(P)-dependent oxidoreductase [Flavobacterium aquariorum]PZX92494.1 hypothetical protein DOS84_15360 [Flavobacterium aquariorum]
MKKIVIITGTNRGLGKSFVDLALNDKNSRIISISRSLHEDHKEIDSNKLLLIKTDLSEPFSTAVIEILKKEINQDSIIYYFNNAGVILPINKIGNFKNNEIYSSINININYPVNFINELLSNFYNNKTILINVTSGAGNNPIEYWSLYCSSKAYMKMFFKVLEEENLNNKSLKLYSVDPGVLDTKMQLDIRKNEFPENKYFSSLKEEDKLVKPEEAAEKIFDTINFYS